MPPMVEEPYDTYIDFGFDDEEATSFASPADSQNLPPFLVEILAALNSGPSSSHVEEPIANGLTFPSPPALPSESYTESILPIYYSIPTPSSSLRSSLSEHRPSTSVYPSDIIRVHSAAPPAPPVLAIPPAFLVLPAPQPSTQYAHVPPAIFPQTSSKRPRDYIENSAPHKLSSPKRQRTATFDSNASVVNHASNSIANAPPLPKVMAEAAHGGPGAMPSMDWGILPGPESGTVAGPSIVEIENVPVPPKSRKRARKDKSDGPATSKKRHKKTVLADAPEVLNAPVTPYSGLQFVDYGPPPASAGDEASTLLSATYPELTPEFYEELCSIASEIAQEFKQTSGGVDGTSGSIDQDVLGSSTASATHGIREDNSQPSSATTKGKRPRALAPPKGPRKKRRRTDVPTNANVLSSVADTDAKPEKREKRFGCPFLTDATKPCLVRFSRQTDIKRHIRTHHLGCEVFCTHEIHRGKPTKVTREDGVFRHLGFKTCIGLKARAALVAECRKAKSGEPHAGTKRWETEVEREISRRHTLFKMPCNDRLEFWTEIERLSGWTPDTLEKWFKKRGTVERYLCESCLPILQAGDAKTQILDKERTVGTYPGSTVEPIAGPSSSGSDAGPVGLSSSLDVLAVPDDED
ncbi:hypothetical protein GSI_03830 [Ganoderma sinense ZZ0214-1]|uniref:Uncharacterized protein n=1 Tax=Ganoderma sinense ZZ0214-1 TaxID=1077348 RepID=A0A2G8SK18_9APHY|nr:hypothetical protein GSI_03830 [Ganoderma sinense ZZ0214-1]